MKKLLILAFERRKELVDDEHLLDGYISLRLEGDTGESSSVEGFNGISYAKMIGLFSKAARSNLYADLAMLRLDQRPTPTVFMLSDEQAALIREDPVAYIKATSIRRTASRVKSDRSSDRPQGPLPGGYDTVVSSFGDLVYLKRAGSMVECPACGRWVEGEELEQNDVLLECSNCGATFAVALEADRWASIATEALIQSSFARFFIPRLWNKGGPWITREDLEARYTAFCKERQDAIRKQ